MSGSSLGVGLALQHLRAELTLDVLASLWEARAKAMQAVDRLIKEEQEPSDVPWDSEAVRRIRVECGLTTLKCSSRLGMPMKLLLIMLYIGFAVSIGVQGQTNPVSPTVETLICIRHGEKQATGLGQLSCQGLNRALALPRVLPARYGPPQFLFAPDPTQTITEYAGAYYYVRPLATIEPTAIYCGLPVNTQFGFTQITALEGELQKDAYHNATIYIAWEHILLDTFAKDMVKAYGGDPAQVPAWPANDYDTVFVVKIRRDQGQESVAFTIDHEGLNNLSDDCLQAQIRSASPGVRTNQFGFSITGPSNIAVVVEASTNLANPTWSPVRTNILNGDSSYFSDPQWTNYSSRFYRLSWP